MDAKETIKSYLDERARTDELFAKAYAKEGKSIDECFSYILGEARKKGTQVCMSDEEVFGLAVHYYDEDDIKVSPIRDDARVTTSQDVKLSAEDEKAARDAAIRRLTEEQYSLLKKRPQRAKKEADVQQMSLF